MSKVLYNIKYNQSELALALFLVRNEIIKWDFSSKVLGKR